MLGEMTPEEFDERYAHYHAKPWGDDWEQASYICAAIHNAIVTVHGGEPRRPDYFIKDFFPEDNAEVLDSDQEEDLLKRMGGQ